MHQASGAGNRKSPKRFSLLTFVLIGGTEDFKNRVTHISVKSRPISLCWPMCWTRLGGVRNGRDALSRPTGGRAPTGCGRDKRGPPACPPETLRPRQARPSRVLDQYDNPIIFHTLQWVKQRVSQPQNQSPCPRASARSVLTGRRPTVRHAPRAARVLRAPISKTISTRSV